MDLNPIDTYLQVSVYHLNKLDTNDNYFCHVCYVPKSAEIITGE